MNNRAPETEEEALARAKTAVAEAAAVEMLRTQEEKEKPKQRAIFVNNIFKVNYGMYRILTCILLAVLR